MVGGDMLGGHAGLVTKQAVGDSWGTERPTHWKYAHSHNTLSHISPLNTYRLKSKNITLEMSPRALTYSVSQSYDPAYGARPLRRWLDHHVITDLSRMIVSGDLPDSSLVFCDARDAPDSSAPAVPGMTPGLVYRVTPKPEQMQATGPAGVGAGLKGKLMGSMGDDWDEEAEGMEV